MEEVLKKLDTIIELTQSNDVLIAALIGALAAIVPQVLFWFLNNCKEKKQAKKEIKSDLFRLLHLMKDHYRELAMHKAHKFYWYAQYENSESENDKKEMEKFYASHMRSGASVRGVELKISETFSEFYKQVIKFQHFSEFDDKIDELIEEYYSFEPEKPDYIDYTKSDLPREENKEEKRLNKEYEKFNKILSKIVNKINSK
jgi:hypothetical protein